MFKAKVFKDYGQVVILGSESSESDVQKAYEGHARRLIGWGHISGKMRIVLAQNKAHTDVIEEIMDWACEECSVKNRFNYKGKGFFLNG